jgi:WD40-like Beta Propeller Repeat
MRGATTWLVWVMLLCASSLVVAESAKSGNPEDHLPSNITQLTGFGERASWSPDGKRIAFMAKSFKDAFEIDLKTKLTRLLTGHFYHEGSSAFSICPTVTSF